MIAKVAVEKTAYHFDGLFDYDIPKYLCKYATPGKRVLIPFGTGNKRRQGMIFEVYNGDKERIKNLKAIIAILDKTPVLSEELLSLAKHVSFTTFCPLYEAVRAMLPPGINFKPVWMYSLIEDAPLGDDLSPEEKEILDYLRKKGKALQSGDLINAFSFCNADMLEGMVQRGILTKSDGAKRKVGDESAKMVRLIANDENSDENEKKLTPKQSAVYSFLQETGTASQKEVCYYTGVTPAVLNNLALKGVIEFYEQGVYRSPFMESDINKPKEEIILSPEQEKAFNGIRKIMASGNPTVSLLYGVTGSGKTQVFIKLIEETRNKGKQVIMMVPEISLTPQMVDRFLSFFGSDVAVMHSALSVGERLDEWKRVKEGKANIVIGTRTAVFAPTDNTGLIIIDEEQEQSYKSDRSPRFHARDVAIYRSKYNKAPLVLASATPSIESFYKAKAGAYSMFTMKKRYGGAKLPDTYIVNMKEEAGQGHTGAISTALMGEIEANISKGEQSILLLNRRGYNTIARCADCGKVEECPHCSIPLVYHKANERLMCHYCGYSKDVFSTCSQCGSKYMMYTGLGTQRVEDELKNAFPRARIMRMDQDSTMAKYSHEKLFSSFSKGESDIMIGTQMVAKGLDFPNVTLVGVLSADMSLYTGDYRSYERTFALLTQVVGRCGRSDLPGRAYIQTYSPEHSVIEHSAAQDYDEFYEEEIINRKVMLYPPFCSMGVLTFTGANNKLTGEGASSFTDILKTVLKESGKAIPIRILGPTKSHIEKLAGKYRWKLILKYKANRDFFTLMKDALCIFAKDKRFTKIEVTPDPYFDGMV